MAGEFSFDIVSDFDRQELVNAADQTKREMQQRYDLKSSGATRRDSAGLNVRWCPATPSAAMSPCGASQRQ